MSDHDRIGCEEALRRLAAYLDQELDSAQSAELERHIETCRSCFSRAEFERRLKERIRDDLSVPVVPPDCERRMRVLLRKLHQES